MMPYSPVSERPDIESEAIEGQIVQEEEPTARLSSTDNNNRWLSIDAACKILGVDQSTLRRWSDRGKVPVFRTPGGHRRYREADMHAFVAGDRATRRRMNRQQLTSMSLAGYEPDFIELASSRPWYHQYDDTTLSGLRTLGRKLVDLAMRYISGRGNREVILRDGKTIGKEYGEIAASAGLTSLDTLEAFLFFRRPIIQSITGYLEKERFSTRRAGRTVNELTVFLDEVLMATLEAHRQATRAR